MLICQNAEGVHSKQKVGNPCSKAYKKLLDFQLFTIRVFLIFSDWYESNAIKLSREKMWI